MGQTDNRGLLKQPHTEGNKENSSPPFLPPFHPPPLSWLVSMANSHGCQYAASLCRARQSDGAAQSQSCCPCCYSIPLRREGLVGVMGTPLSPVARSCRGLKSVGLIVFWSRHTCGKGGGGRLWDSLNGSAKEPLGVGVGSPFSSSSLIPSPTASLHLLVLLLCPPMG